MKLVSVGIDLDHIEFTTDHVSVEPFDGSLLKTHWLFYYVVLETKPQFKKKLSNMEDENGLSAR